MNETPYIILNPEAGGGRARRAEPAVRRVLSGAELSGFHLALTRHPGHAAELAAEAARGGFPRVIVLGGDGTVNEVVNGLLSVTDPPVLAVVPVGTGNDLARDLGLPRGLEAALRLAVTGGSTRSLDVARCGDRCFMNVAGLGFDARVAAAAARFPRALRLGPLPFVAGVLIELLRNTAYAVDVHLDGSSIHRRVLMVAVANGRYYGGGMKIAPEASREDGLLDVCIVEEAARWEVLRMLPRVFSGAHVGHPKVELHRARVVRVEGPPDMLVEVDGDLTGTAPVELGVFRAALRVVVPDAQAGRRGPSGTA